MVKFGQNAEDLGPLAAIATDGTQPGRVKALKQQAVGGDDRVVAEQELHVGHLSGRRPANAGMAHEILGAQKQTVIRAARQIEKDTRLRRYPKGEPRLTTGNRMGRDLDRADIGALRDLGWGGGPVPHPEKGQGAVVQRQNLITRRKQTGGSRTVRGHDPGFRRNSGNQPCAVLNKRGGLFLQKIRGQYERARRLPRR